MDQDLMDSICYNGPGTSHTRRSLRYTGLERQDNVTAGGGHVASFDTGDDFRFELKLETPDSFLVLPGSPQ